MNVEDTKKSIAAAGGGVRAELVLKNALYLDVFTLQLRRGDIAISGGKILGIGSYVGEREEDMTSAGVVTPGLTDGHIHIESTRLSPEQFARLAVPRGTTCIIADPHEIVNVCGFAGADYMRTACARTPLNVKLMLPSCVPATPFETGGATLTAADTASALAGGGFFGLGEMMNYPGVISGDEEALKKIAAAQNLGMVVDGHAPALTGEKLNAYAYCGARTDHECATAAEAEEKVSKGMYVLLREGSASHDLARLAPAVNAYNFRRFAMCTDDRHADDLFSEGHMDHVLRTAVKCGIDGKMAAAICTFGAAECYRLAGKGAIAPGYDADLAVFTDLERFECRRVYIGGKLVAQDGKALFDCSPQVPQSVKNTVNIAEITPQNFAIRLKGTRVRAIQLFPGTLVTGAAVCEVQSRGGDVLLSGSGLVKLAVIERHFASGNMALGFLRGYGFKGGAIATTVAHDSHNLIVAGDDNAAMCVAARELKRIGGGMAVVRGHEVYSVPLDIAGLMSSAPAEEHASHSARLYGVARSMGVEKGIEPFMTLCFAALAVIPELRLTDRGLFDVNKFTFVPLEAD